MLLRPNLLRWLRLPALVADRAGNVLVFTGIGMLVIAALVGGAVDLGFTWKAQNRLQGACDAAILAGRRAVTTNGYDATAQAQATAYFNANYVPAQQGTRNTAFSSSSPDNGVTIAGTATTTVPLRIMPLFGRSAITVTANCSGTMGISNTDITFVLDTTGSMLDTPAGFSSSKIVTLQAAMKSFYATMANSVAGTTARVRYAFVPFSSTVNVGHLLYAQNPDWLVDSYAFQSRVPRFETTTMVKFSGGGNSWVKRTEQVYGSNPNSNLTQLATAYASQAACIAAMPADTGWSNNGSASNQSTWTQINGNWVNTTITSQPQVMTSYTCQRAGDSYYVWSYRASWTLRSYSYQGYNNVNGTSSSTTFDHFDYKLAAFDTSSYKRFLSASANVGDNGASVSSTWDGCIEERQTVASGSVAWNSATQAITPAAATDLDIDTAPTTSDATKWAPLWPELAYYRTSGYNLTNAAVSMSGSQAPSYCPAQAQSLATMTQSDFDTYVDGLVAVGGTYHDIGMLWGARLSSPTGIFSSIVTTPPSNGGNVSRHLIFMTDGLPGAAYWIQQAYGIEWHDRRITDDGYTDDDNRHVARFRALCDAVKAKGIRVWVIGYDTSLTSDLSYCASPSSAFTALNAAQLDAAFQTIAKQVGELRIEG